MNSPLVIMASGPSLTEAAIDHCMKKRCDVMVINDNYKLTPWVDYVVANDRNWVEEHLEDIEEKTNALVYVPRSAPMEDNTDLAGKSNIIRLFDGVHGDGLNEDSSIINFGGCSPHAALGLAYKFGYDHIITIGIDCVGSDNRWHEHRDKKYNRAGDYSGQLPPLNKMIKDLRKKGVRVDVCEGSALDGDKVKLEDVL